MLVPWTALRPSKRARRWRLVGIGIAVASSVALFTAAAASAPFDASLAILAGIVGVTGLTAIRERPDKPLEVGVLQTGEIKIRECLQPKSEAPNRSLPSESMPLHVVFAATWLISLRCGTMFVPIWPDCLPPSIYRQLWVHLRWGRAVPDGSRQTKTNKFMDR